MTSQRCLAAVALCAALVACNSGDTSPTTSTSGEYTLKTFDGVALHGNLNSTTVLDTGYATLGLAGSFSMYVRVSSNGVPETYVNEAGEWTEAASGVHITLSNGTPIDAATTAAGALTIPYLMGTTHTLVFVRTGDTGSPDIVAGGPPGVP